MVGSHSENKKKTKKIWIKKCFILLMTDKFYIFWVFKYNQTAVPWCYLGVILKGIHYQK